MAFDKLTALKRTGVNFVLGMGFSSHITLAASYIEQNDILVISHDLRSWLNVATDDAVLRLVPSVRATGGVRHRRHAAMTQT